MKPPKRVMSRDVIVFATPPATDLIEANGIDCVVASENVETFKDQAIISAAKTMGEQVQRYNTRRACRMHAE